MKLLIIVISLLCERYLPHSISTQRFNWFPHYCEKINNVIKNQSQAVLLLITILPLIIGLYLLLWILGSLFWGLIGFILSLFVFYYCLGPENPFYPIADENDADNHSANAANYFSKSNTTLFSVIFWFIVAGPVGLLLYRLLTLSTGEKLAHPLVQPLVDYLDWITSRFTVLFYLLSGNFQKGIGFYTENFLSSPQNNEVFLSEGGLLAAKEHMEDEVISLAIAQNIVERALIINIIIIALLTLGARL